MSTAKQLEMGLAGSRKNGRPVKGAIQVTMSPEAWLALEIVVSPDLVSGPYQDSVAPALTHATMTEPRARLARRLLQKARTSAQPLPDALQEYTSGSALDAIIRAEQELERALNGNPLTGNEWLRWMSNGDSS